MIALVKMKNHKRKIRFWVWKVNGLWHLHEILPHGFTVQALYPLSIINQKARISQRLVTAEQNFMLLKVMQLECETWTTAASISFLFH